MPMMRKNWQLKARQGNKNSASSPSKKLSDLGH